MLEIGMMVIAAPAPNPAAVRPAARPRLSGNSFSALPTQVPYTEPAPTPAITAAKYSCGSVVAYESIVQPSAARMAPNAITGRGPYLSTSQPSTGTNQVSTRIKIENDNWMADRPQWFLASNGLTNKVQAYCRLATKAMHCLLYTSPSPR